MSIRYVVEEKVESKWQMRQMGGDKKACLLKAVELAKEGKNIRAFEEIIKTKRRKIFG